MNLLTEEIKFHPTWWSKLRAEFLNGYMIMIYENILKNYKLGLEVVPSSKQLYKPLRECSFDNTLVCFILEKPIVNYNKSKLYQSISKWIEEEAYEGLNLHLQDNLDYLADKGVINIPLYFTEIYGQSLDKNWLNFSFKIINELNKSLNSILFIIESDIYDKIPKFDKHKYILLEEGCIKTANDFLQKEYNTQIKW